MNEVEELHREIEGNEQIYEKMETKSDPKKVEELTKLRVEAIKVIYSNLIEL
ncbi:MAG: hypothetical protein AOA65_1033 [Candidatus Bathyarchaeota archaeon BA1]|nr:MAG: hypothetical protein AOA65_1033 [Candidatus Bathyarchaeota archaeon BA1]